MSCPHGAGEPDNCSQCAGAKARIVKLDSKTGAVTVNGKKVKRDFGGGDPVMHGRRPISAAGKAAARRK
jgi:hypothetical protein